MFVLFEAGNGTYCLIRQRKHWEALRDPRTAKTHPTEAGFIQSDAGFSENKEAEPLTGESSEDRTPRGGDMKV